jgi:hypothetical protein
MVTPSLRIVTSQILSPGVSNLDPIMMQRVHGPGMPWVISSREPTTSRETYGNASWQSGGSRLIKRGGVKPLWQDYILVWMVHTIRFTHHAGEIIKVLTQRDSSVCRRFARKRGLDRSMW